MKIRWLRRALRNVEDAFVQITQNSPKNAAEVVGRIEAAVRQLAEHPLIGRSGRVKGTRELVVLRTPYIVAYRVRGERVEILRVLQGAMRWPRRL